MILYENSKLAMVLESDSDYERIYYEGNFKIFKKLTDEEINQKMIDAQEAQKNVVNVTK